MKIITRGSLKVYSKAKSLEDERKRQSGNGNNASRYKTELCRPFQEYGYCKYSDKCQFAHGEHELRALPRHPKYKTELCRTFHSKGFCPYGPRCHFIHNLDEIRKPTDSNGPRSPKKTTGFNLPISPSLDSGISSPDDFSGYAGSKTFEFPATEGSRSDENNDREPDRPIFFYQSGNTRDDVYSPDVCMQGINGLALSDSIREQREEVPSPDPFEFDVLSSAGSSPTKPVSEEFCSDEDLRDLFLGISLEDSGSTSRSSSGHRLPVFDDMLNSKSDTALSNAAMAPYAIFSD